MESWTDCQQREWSPLGKLESGHGQCKPTWEEINLLFCLKTIKKKKKKKSWNSNFFFFESKKYVYIYPSLSYWFKMNTIVAIFSGTIFKLQMHGQILLYSFTPDHHRWFSWQRTLYGTTVSHNHEQKYDVRPFLSVRVMEPASYEKYHSF